MNNFITDSISLNAIEDFIKEKQPDLYAKLKNEGRVGVWVAEKHEELIEAKEEFISDGLNDLEALELAREKILS